jgi:hypothetical protein
VKTLQHLRSQRLQELVAAALGSLASTAGGLRTLLHHLLDGLQLEQWRREVLWLLGLLAAGLEARKAEAAAREALEELVEALLLVLRCGGAGAGAVRRAGPVTALREEWTAELLALEALGRAGGLLGPGPHTPPLLLAALHTTDLTDRLAAHTLYFALQDLARGHGGDIPSLLSSCVDHLARDLNLELRRPRVEARPGLGTLVRVVLRLAGEEQARTDLQDTIEILLLHLAASDADSTLNILNIVKVFVYGVREKIMLKEDAAKTKESEDNMKEDSKGMVTRMILGLEAELVEEEREREELEQEMDCPEEGFHDEQNPEEEEPSDDAETPLTPDQQFLKVG